MKCRLCLQEKELCESHIVSKMFADFIKVNSPTGRLREISNPNMPVQDITKPKFLCTDCEQLFGKYEKKFSDKIFIQTKQKDGDIELEARSYNLSYFLLSIAWRTLKYIVEYKSLDNVSQNEMLCLNEVLEHWRNILLNENHDEINRVQQFIIPTKKLKVFEGDTDKMKAFSVSNNKIKARNSTLPENIEIILRGFIQDFNKSKDNLSESQIEKIIKKANKT
ncbi:MAG: hypothetical protein R3Y05_05990 [bacterium]